MKKIKKFLLGNVKTVVAFILGIIISGGTVYAATILFDSDEVSYDNTTSGLAATNVQAAIDELGASRVKIKDNTVYFAYGNPTTSSTTDYTTLNKRVFVAKNGDQKSVCIIRNSRLHCFDNNNYDIEKEHIQQVFSDISCGVFSANVGCNASDFFCRVGSDGYVRCSDNGSSENENCEVYSGGEVLCG